MIECHTERSRSAEKGKRVISVEFGVMSFEHYCHFACFWLAKNVSRTVEVLVPYQQYVNMLQKPLTKKHIHPKEA